VGEVSNICNSLENLLLGVSFANVVFNKFLAPAIKLGGMAPLKKRSLIKAINSSSDLVAA
jgi:hypothetical protein